MVAIDVEKYGPWVVIAGGSEGVGAALAREFADAGLNLVLIARKPEPLDALAAELSDRVEVRTLYADLLAPDALERVRALTDPLDVGLFIFNAGANTYRGLFVDGDPAGQQGVLDLNITAPLAFTRHFGARLKERGRGGLVLVGSLSSFVGHGNIGLYVAAKAFLRVFAEGLWWEMKPYGVDVLELCLPLTRTPAMERLGLKFDTPGMRSSDPAVVAREAIEHLADGPSWIADGHGDEAIAMASYPRAAAVEAANANYRRAADD